MRKGDYRDHIKFQKALAVATRASNKHEAHAAELAARRLMAALEIDPVLSPDRAFTSNMNFADSGGLLEKLRDEWRAAHPGRIYKIGRFGYMRWVNRPKPAKSKAASAKPKPVNTKPEKRTEPDSVGMYAGMFEDYMPRSSVNTTSKSKPKPTAKPVNTKSDKPRSDRNRDRHSPGYMREYMRRRRA